MIQTLIIVDCKFQRGRAFKRQRVAEKTWERNDGQTNQNGRQPSVNKSFPDIILLKITNENKIIVNDYFVAKC